jgi:hypothetical protein
MFKKPTVLLIIVLAGAWLSYELVMSLVPDETQIEWLISGMAEDFNDASAGGVGKGLSDEFVEEKSDFDRRTIVLALMHLMRQDRTSDGTFALRARLSAPPDITVHDTDPPTADVHVRVEFSRLPRRASDDARSKVLGLLQFEGKCLYEHGDWRIVKSTHDVLEGRRPF